MCALVGVLIKCNWPILFVTISFQRPRVRAIQRQQLTLWRLTPPMFRSYDHPQWAYFVPCCSYSLKTLSDLYRYIAEFVFNNFSLVVF